jgi:hypothetical protein
MREIDDIRRLKSQGQVGQGWLMLRQAVRLAEQMRILHPSTLSRPKNKMLPEIERVRTITAWGIFHLNS